MLHTVNNRVKTLNLSMCIVASTWTDGYVFIIERFILFIVVSKLQYLSIFA